MRSRSLLLHVCCAPCVCFVAEILKDNFDLSAFFYNPNIAPPKEHDKRLEELKKFSKETEIDLIIGRYDPLQWTLSVKHFRFAGERSERCRICYKFRLEETFKRAAQLRIGIVATTLSVSPHKDAYMINTAGEELADQYGIEFFKADFKKNDGCKRSVEISRQYGFYRQNYCGCIYSKMERNKNSLWMKKTEHLRKK